MVAVAAVVGKAVHVLHVVNLACASGMEAARGARWRTAKEVQKVILASASRMAVEGAVNFQSAPRVPREAQSSVRRMVEESAAHSWVAPKELKVALLSARGTVEVSAAHFRAVVSAQRVCMVELIIVLLTAVGRGALCQAAPRALEGGQNTVYAMVVVRGASSRVVKKVRRAALISVRHMEEANAALGARWAQALVSVDLHVINLLGAKLVFVQLTVL